MTAAALPPSSICPECAAGKHDNCDGTAWDFDHDVLTDCECVAAHRHREGGQ